MTLNSTRFYLVHAMPSDPLLGYRPEESDQWKQEVMGTNAEVLIVGQPHNSAHVKAGVKVGISVDKRTGCWICGEVLEAVFRFLSKHQHQLTIDRAAQEEHAKRGGFCSLHTWQYENISSPYGVCASYPALVHRLALGLQTLAGDVNGPIRTFESISNLGALRGTCQACQVRIKAERNAVNEAADRIREITSSKAGNMPACCLVHLAMTTAVLGKGQPAQLLLGAYAQFLERLGEDVQRYALRHDALRRHQTSEEERRASQLLLLMLAGHHSPALAPLAVAQARPFRAVLLYRARYRTTPCDGTVALMVLLDFFVLPVHRSSSE